MTKIGHVQTSPIPLLPKEVTKKGDVCTHVGYAENENGLSPCEWIYNQRPTSRIFASHIKDSFDLKQVPF